MYALVCALLSLSVLSAQQEGEVITFMGIPVDGELEIVVEKLKEKGFSPVKEAADSLSKAMDGVIMKGEFAGYEECFLAIMPTPKTKQVYAIVAFPEHIKDYKQLEAEYKKQVANYSKVHGQPIQEEMGPGRNNPTIPGLPADQYDKLPCMLSSHFRVKGGVISIMLSGCEQDPETTMKRVGILYINEKNRQVMFKESIELAKEKYGL